MEIKKEYVVQLLAAFTIICANEILKIFVKDDYISAILFASYACASNIDLGIFYAEGQGVEKNHIKAYELFRDALKQGNSDAQNNLSILCRESPWACK